MHKSPTLTRLLLACLLLWVLDTIPGNTHPEHTSYELSELNDYLMALQVMRHQNPAADDLFHRWQELREASWEIREWTDDRDLTIDAPEVERQIEHTIRLREMLLNDCRTFFRKQSEVLPTARIHLGKDLRISWEAGEITAPVGSRRVVLLEITSEREEPEHLFLTGEDDDEILFWSKPVTVSGNHPRYTFAYIAPLESGKTEASVSIRWRENTTRHFTIRAEGMLPADYSWYNHVPAKTRYNIDHAGRARTEKMPAFDTDTKRIRFRIRDPKSGHPMPVRVEVRDRNGNAYWTPLRGPSVAVEREEVGFETSLWTFQPGPYFYIGGEAELGVDPSGKSIRIYHGFEYEPVVMTVPEDGIVDTAPRRWIDMKSRGWYSGHTHIHTTDVGLPVQYNRFWPTVTRAEDLGVSSILTLQGERTAHSIYADEYPMGPLQSPSTPDHLITYGEEYRNNPFGHLALLGLDYLLLPVSSGSLGEIGGPDYPPNQFILNEAHSQGATTIGAHFGNYIMGEGPITASWPSTGFEMPVNVALGKMDLAEIYGNGGQREVWYRLLNCGFDLPATAGPDWVIKDSPRAYVYLGETSFTVDSWLEGLRQGHSFITKGPMLFFTVEGKLPGGQLHFDDRPQSVSVHASALTPDGAQPVEIVVNGEVVASGTDLNRSVELDDSAWIAARTKGAHSNPVFVTLQGRPRASENDARTFIKITDRLKEWVNTKGLYENEQQMQTVLNVLDEGRNVFENIIDRAGELESR